MRFWLGGPRILGVRTGVSFGREDFRPSRRATRAAPTASQPTGSFVYVITGDHNLVKIGVSTNPNARLANLQTSSPFPLRLSFVGATPGTGYDIEQEAHGLLASHRLEGEWFDVSPEMAASAVMGGAARISQKLQSVEPRSIDQILRIAGMADGGASVALVEKKRPWAMWIIAILFGIWVAVLFATTLLSHP